MDRLDDAGGLHGRARPLVKWTGGKGGELPLIRSARPESFGRLLEPFVGGGAVLFDTPSSIPAEANDMSADLVSLYRMLAEADAALTRQVRLVDIAWKAVESVTIGSDDRDDEAASSDARAASEALTALDPAAPERVEIEARRALRRKRTALARFAAQGQEIRDAPGLLASALKSAVYTAIRTSYNAATPGTSRTAMFWFLRDFCYGGMFRTNASGGCNVPYGGMSYDRRSMAGRLAQAASSATRTRLANTRFHRGDFEVFLDEVAPGPQDFAFLDPPYDSPFSTYDGSAFSRADHLRLSATLERLPCRWMLVISETPFVREAYFKLPNARITAFDKGYAVNIKQRFERRTRHLMVTNYEPTADSHALAA